MSAGIFASKTPGVVLAEIEMLRAISPTASFIVEGHDDFRFWKERVAAATVKIVNCEGKQNLIEVARQASQSGKNYIAGVYDPDFDRISGIRHFADFLAVTDENDLEILLLRSPCLDRVLGQLADADKIEIFETANQTSVLDHIECIARRFGELRFINHQQGLGVNFDDLSPYRFVQANDWSLDLTALHQEFIRISGISKDDLDLQLAALISFEKWSLAQGHDCLKIFSQGMKNVLAKRQANEADWARFLALAFEHAHLAATRMHADLKEIEYRLGLKLIK